MPRRASAASSPPEAWSADAPWLVYVLGRTTQGVARELRVGLAPFDLSLPEFTTLSVLHLRPGLSNAQLARRAMITPQSMNRVLTGLEERGLVHRETDAGHKRVLRTRLTPKGQILLDKASPTVLALQDRLLGDVPLRHRRIVLRTLLGMMDKLSDEGG